MCSSDLAVSLHENLANHLTAVVEDAIGFRSPTSDPVSVSFGAVTETFSSNGVTINVTIPLDITSSNQTILLDLVPTSSLETDNGPAPRFHKFDLAFDLDLENQPDVIFSGEVTITVQLPESFESTQSVIVNYWDTTLSPPDWSSQGITVNAFTTSQITFTTNHFSRFIVGSLFDHTPPEIGIIKIDSEFILDNYFYSPSPVIAVDIEDLESGIASWSIQLIDTQTQTVRASSTSHNLLLKTPTEIHLTTPGTLPDSNYEVQVDVWNNSIHQTTKSNSFKIGNTSLSLIALHAPNPFNPTVSPLTISYNLSQTVDTFDIYIYSLSGDIVWSYQASSSGTTAGYHAVQWTGFDDFSQIIPNGLYYGYCIAKKGIIVKKEKLKIAILR